MVALSVFQPFLRIINYASSKGTISQVLREHFRKPAPLQSVKGTQDVVDTGALLRKLKVACQKHHQQTDLGLSVMLDSKAFEDPHEVWMRILQLTKAERQIDGQLAGSNQKSLDSVEIGWQQETKVTCKKCQSCRKILAEGSHNSQPLNLFYFSVSTSQTLSVQSALQHYFGVSDDLSTECKACQKQETSHTEFTECIQAEEGLVLYTTISEDNKQEFMNRDFQLERTIFLPFQGHASNLQSAFRLRAVTAQPIGKAHHFAVVYDDHGNPWTYDDERNYQGMPKEKWVQLLLFY
jgi:hypothetical protein